MSKYNPILNDNFKRWFGDSKVVDENGQPLVCYHGSTVNIEEFSHNYAGDNTGNNFEKVFYFTSDEDAAITYSQEAVVRQNEWKFYDEEEKKNIEFTSWQEYSDYLRDQVFEDPKINPCYLCIENPYILDANGEVFDYKKNYTLLTILKGNMNNIDYSMWDSDIEEELKDVFYEYDEENEEYIEKGVSFDGVIIKNVIDNITDMYTYPIDEYIVWDPRQIKSVYNKGIWDMTNANVMESIKEDIVNIDDFKFSKYMNNVREFSNDLLELGQIANPSNPYDWIADKMEDMANWTKKDWEALFKKELSFKDIRDARITFSELAKQIRQVADSYAHADKRFKESLGMEKDIMSIIKQVKSNKLNESIQDDVTNALNLIIEGLGHLVFDAYYNKFEKRFDRIKKMKQPKAQLKNAKDLLLNIQGRLIDAPYDEYNAKVDEFLFKKNESTMLNSCNESVEWNLDKIKELKSKIAKFNREQSFYDPNAPKNGSEWSTRDLPNKYKEKFNEICRKTCKQHLDILDSKYNLKKQTDNNNKPYETYIDTDVDFGTSIENIIYVGTGIITNNSSYIDKIKWDYGKELGLNLIQKIGHLPSREVKIYENTNLLILTEEEHFSTGYRGKIVIFDKHELDNLEKEIDKQLSLQSNNESLNEGQSIKKWAQSMLPEIFKLLRKNGIPSKDYCVLGHVEICPNANFLIRKTDVEKVLELLPMAKENKYWDTNGNVASIRIEYEGLREFEKTLKSVNEEYKAGDEITIDGKTGVIDSTFKFAEDDSLLGVWVKFGKEVKYYTIEELNNKFKNEEKEMNEDIKTEYAIINYLKKYGFATQEDLYLGLGVHSFIIDNAVKELLKQNKIKFDDTTGKIAGWRLSKDVKMSEAVDILNQLMNEAENLDDIWGIEMFLDTVEGDPEPGPVEFTKIGLIDYINDEYNENIQYSVSDDELKHLVLELTDWTVKYIK